MDARLIAAFLAPFAIACSSSQTCTTQAVAGVSLVVKNGASGAAICDAKITAHGTADATIMATPGGTPCSYTGLYEQPGTYDITIERDGFVTKTLPGVKVGESSDGCHHAVTYIGSTTLDPVTGAGDAGL